jgi:hypothetical protein
LKGVAKMSETLGEVMHGAGVVASWTSATVSAIEAFQNPTVGNITKAVLETGWASVQTFCKVNPYVAGVITAVEVANAIFKWR